MRRGTLAWLPLLLVSACGGEAAKTLSREQLLDPASCADCHQSHVDQWQGSMHAYAADDPVFLAMNQRGQEETQGALGDFCVNCHAPMAVREGATTDGLNLGELPQYLKGVTCYFCHSVDAVEGTHNNPLRLADDLVLRGAIRDPYDNEAHLAGYSPLLDRNDRSASDLCGSCHDIVLDNAVHLERTYSEWQASLFGNGSSGGLGCGNCHMAGDEAPAASVDGVPLREVHDHRMPGVDIALTPWPFHDEHRAQVEAELLGTLVGQMCIPPPLAETTVEVTLENAFAGHSFPSGAAHDRRAWLELVVYDETEQVIFETGVIAADEATAEVADDNLWLLRDHVRKADGSDAHMFWEVASVESELLDQAATSGPGVVHAKTRTFTIPLSAGLPARATMRVLMRPLGLEVLADLVQSGHLDPSIPDVVPTFEVIRQVEWVQARDGYGCVPPGVF
ncbi:MAG: multiheme c-type cytochrome [Polyangiaceae bacterium]